MKFGPDEIRKLCLSALVAVGVIYVYFAMLLGPLQRAQVATREQITALQPGIDAANAQIAKFNLAERSAPEARTVINQVNGSIPEGSPVAWFPPHVAEFFLKQGLEKPVTRLIAETGGKTLEGYRWSVWGVEFPQVDFVSFGRALAKFESDEPLLEITALTLQTNSEDVETQRASLTLGNILNK